MISQPAVLSRNSRTRGAVLALILVCGAGSLRADTAWETWSSDTFTLQPRETFQFHVGFADIQVRSWKLVVDGGLNKCDLSVLRVQGESLVYYQTDESRHEAVIPWGKGEEIIVVMTNRQHQATFAVNLLGPPRDQVHAAYSYHVNRSLEAFASGRRLDAEDECEKALKEDPADGVAKVLLAGFLRDRNFYTRASAYIEGALEDDLPAEMRTLAEGLAAELELLRAPLPQPVADQVARAEELLGKGQALQALDICRGLAADHPDLPNQARSRIEMLRGQALDGAGRDFEAVDAFTQALSFSRNRNADAVIYFHMGRLFLKMDNLAQAQGSYTIALQYGLPSGLDVQAREALVTIGNRLGK